MGGDFLNDGEGAKSLVVEFLHRLLGLDILGIKPDFGA